jgi:protein-S-isoprenylcysteine O-methyltransferase Ste14
MRSASFSEVIYGLVAGAAVLTVAFSAILAFVVVLGVFFPSSAGCWGFRTTFADLFGCVVAMWGGWIVWHASQVMKHSR